MKLPAEIVNRIHHEWGAGMPEQRQHAAKQLSCYLDRIGRYNTDENLKLDETLAIGAATVNCSTPESFVAWWLRITATGEPNTKVLNRFWNEGAWILILDCGHWRVFGSMAPTPETPFCCGSCGS